MYASRNPYTNEVEKTFLTASDAVVLNALESLNEGFKFWSRDSLLQRLSFLPRLSSLLTQRKLEFATLIATEMGKPIAQGEAEILKCAQLCDYYFLNAEKYLNSESFHVYIQGLGVILGIMPWNFPFWQVLRFAIPTLLVGNTVLFKHSPNTPQCALAVEDLFRSSGLDQLVIQSIFVDNEQAKFILEHPIVKGVSLTGSEKAGRAVASIAGAQLKPMVMELGGSDPFIICQDASLEAAIDAALNTRCLNAGQTCIAGKRFIVQNTIKDAFVEGLIERLATFQLGDPLDRDIHIGPLARTDLKENLARQVKKSVSLGANLIYEHTFDHDNTNFYPPSILTNLTDYMPIWTEETFGPVYAVREFETVDEAIDLANDTPYGLGASVWTQDEIKANYFINAIDAGNVFVNAIVKSSPNLPFGGVKNSGFGRELGKFGLLSFANIKTVQSSF